MTLVPTSPSIRYPDPKGNGAAPTATTTASPIRSIAVRTSRPASRRGSCLLHARLSKDAFDIRPPILFAAASDKLTADARAAIEEVAATANENPKTIYQVSFGIGTKKGAPQALSDKRAQTILLVLRAAALESERYEVVLRDDLPGGKVVVRVLRP